MYGKAVHITRTDLNLLADFTSETWQCNRYASSIFVRADLNANFKQLFALILPFRRSSFAKSTEGKYLGIPIKGKPLAKEQHSGPDVDTPVLILRLFI